MDWLLTCPACHTTALPDGLPTVCTDCGQPWLVSYPDRTPPGLVQRAELRRGFSMWRFRPFLPIAEGRSHTMTVTPLSSTLCWSVTRSCAAAKG